MNSSIYNYTNALVALCVVMYLIIDQLYQGSNSGLELYYFDSPEFRPWQLITHIFMHANLTHLAFNMFALWSFGRFLESVWGGRRFLIFFLSCGIGAGLISLLVNYLQFSSLYGDLIKQGVSVNELSSFLIEGAVTLNLSQSISHDVLRDIFTLFNGRMVGASGAVYGVLVAFAVMFPNFKLALIFVPVPIAAKYFVPILLLIDLTAGLTGFSIFGANIAHFAHLGGALIGFCLMWWWSRRV